MVQRALLSVKNSHGRFAISMPKDKDDMPEKQRGIILFFQLLNYSLADSLLASEIFYFVKNTVQLSADHHTMWPLCKLWEHRFSVPDFSLPPRWFRPCDRPKPKSPGNIHLTFTLLQFDRFRSRIFLTPAILRAALWCCRFASGATSLRLLVDNLIMLHTSFSFSFVENHFVVKID